MLSKNRNKNRNTVYKYLLNIYGINSSKALKLCIYIGTSPKIIFENLSIKKKERLLKAISFYRKSTDSTALGNNLKVYKNIQLKRKVDTNSYLGKRYKLRLPIRGQRSRTNGKTAKILNKIL